VCIFVALEVCFKEKGRRGGGHSNLFVLKRAQKGVAHLETRSLASAEMVGQGSDCRSRGCRRTLRKMSRSLLPWKGGSPLSKMYRITPALHTSAG
jgi:hypothetical protein